MSLKVPELIHLGLFMKQTLEEHLEWFNTEGNVLPATVAEPERILNELQYLAHTIDLLKFVVNSHAQATLRFSDLVTALLFVSLTIDEKLSDNTKNRNTYLLGHHWELFNVFNGLLIYLSGLHADKPAIAAMQVFFQALLPQVIQQDIPALIDLLQHMHDTQSESFRLAFPNLRLRETFEVMHPYFIEHPDAMTRAVRLQMVIERKVLCGEDCAKEQADLREKDPVRALLPNIGFFCRELGARYALAKIQEILADIEKCEALETFTQRCMFLNLLIELGEYTFNRKLDTSLKEAYPRLPWDTFGLIRDCLVHFDEEERYQILYALLETGRYQDLSLVELRQEIISAQLTDRVGAILRRAYSPLDRVLADALAIQYPVITRPTLSADEQEFMLQILRARVMPGDEVGQRRYANWERVIAGKEPLPFNRERLGKEYLSLVPKRKEVGAANGIAEGDYNRWEMLYQKLVDKRDQGNHYLFPSERVVLEGTAIYRDNREEFLRVLTGQQVISTRLLRQIEEALEPDKELKKPDRVKSYAISAQLILRKVLQCAYWSIFRTLRYFANYDDFQTLKGLFNGDPAMKAKWLPWLLAEEGHTDIPPREEVKADGHVIFAADREEGAIFTGVMSAVISSRTPCPMPMVGGLGELLRGVPAATGHDDHARVLTRANTLRVMIGCLRRVEELVIHYRNSVDNWMRIWFGKAEIELVFPLMNQKMASSLRYREFVAWREKLYQGVYAETAATPGKEVRMPLESVYAKFQELGLDKDPSFGEQASIARSSILEEAWERFQESLRKQLESPEEYGAIMLHLLLSLSLLKKIMKYPEARGYGKLLLIYGDLKKCRNRLGHGDFSTQAFGLGHENLLEALSELAPRLRHCLEDILTLVVRSDGCRSVEFLPECRLNETFDLFQTARVRWDCRRSFIIVPNLSTSSIEIQESTHDEDYDRVPGWHAARYVRTIRIPLNLAAGSDVAASAADAAPQKEQVVQSSRDASGAAAASGSRATLFGRPPVPADVHGAVQVHAAAAAVADPVQERRIRLLNILERRLAGDEGYTIERGAVNIWYIREAGRVEAQLQVNMEERRIAFFHDGGYIDLQAEERHLLLFNDAHIAVPGGMGM